MKNWRNWLFVLGSVFTMIILGACSSSQVDSEVVSSNAAAEIFATQTTLAPTATLAPTKTLVPTDTQEPTLTPTEEQKNQLGGFNVTPITEKKPTPTFQPGIVTTCDQNGIVDIDHKKYIIENNVWNPSTGGEQCLSIDNLTGAFTVTVQTFSQPPDGAPASYPFISMGCHWGSCTSANTMPILVSDIISATSSWSITPAGGAWNATYDIWFNSTPVTGGVPDRAELMIWLNHRGGVWPGAAEVANVNLDGNSFHLHYAQHNPLSYIAYRKAIVTNSLDLDIMAFINDAVARGYIEPSWYLIGVEAGFEIWSGGEGLRSNSFFVTVSGVE